MGVGVGVKLHPALRRPRALLRQAWRKRVLPTVQAKYAVEAVGERGISNALARLGLHHCAIHRHVFDAPATGLRDVRLSDLAGDLNACTVGPTKYTRCSI